MLLRLALHNLALIEHAELELAPGLNVLTGETGAGKTMLAQAVGLLAGAAPAAGMVGPHAAEAYVEAELELPAGALSDPALAGVAALVPDGEETLVIGRRISATGRSRALVWGRSCARADLEALGQRVLEVSSQHEARSLRRPSRQLELLDAFAGAGEARARMADAWREARAARAAVDSARTEASAAARRRLDLEDLVARVDAAAIVPGELAGLRAERERLRHVDELVDAAAAAAELVSPADGDGAQALAARAAELVDAAAPYEAELGVLAADLRDAGERLQESALGLRRFLDGIDADPGRLEEVEGRLELLAGLERRYAAGLPEVVEMAAEARATLERLEGSQAELERLEAEAAAAAAAAAGCAADLAVLRRGSAEGFARAVEAELADLGMADARFSVRCEEAEIGPRGADRVTLELAANPGLPMAPVADTASGGELSRIALAIRVAARAAGGPAALLLDEVDAGVGGRTAKAVAAKLAALAESAQLVVITHLPQIAGVADAHFRVEKTAGDPTAARIERLDDAAVVDELARMLGGEEGDDTARRHAEALRS